MGARPSNKPSGSPIMVTVGGTPAARSQRSCGVGQREDDARLRSDTVGTSRGYRQVGASAVALGPPAGDDPGLFEYL